MVETIQDGPREQAVEFDFDAYFPQTIKLA
jgi:hypothetical protein